MSNNPSKKPEWSALQEHAKAQAGTHINDLFTDNPARFENFSLKLNGLFFDYSKQRITSETIQKLCALAKSCDIEQKRSAMFEGVAINTSENRAVLHTALRRPKEDTVLLDGLNIMPAIHATREKMKDFSNAIRSGNYNGATGKPITQIVSIGIGGSYLGPRAVCEALKGHQKKASAQPSVQTYFVSNIDGDEIKSTLRKCDPETTLFIIISKSFTTQETLKNAKTAKQWLINNLPSDSDISPHFIAVSTNEKEMQKFGITKESIFPMWEWVNGRFSLWSAVGLPICLQLGYDNFEKLMSGAYAIDQHFQTAPLEKNIPVLMALIDIWNRNFLKFQTHAILPYAQKLFYLPLYFRQMEMESNGKNIDLAGNLITDYETSPVIFGTVGTNGQHSFYQLLHQGSDTIPCDFIGTIESHTDLKDHHDILLSNMLAQGQALMQGHSTAQKDTPQSTIEPAALTFLGNKPSSTTLLDRLDSYHLGMLLALYEHKVFTMGAIWNINSFDQFGVELGKELATKIEQNNLSDADSSTSGLFSLIHKTQK